MIVLAPEECGALLLLPASQLLGQRDDPSNNIEMINLRYSLVIEATGDPNFFSFYSPDLEGFTGVGHSVEDCIYKARWGMEEHVALLKERGLPVPKRNPNPTIVIQNERRVAAVGYYPTATPSSLRRQYY